MANQLELEEIIKSLDNYIEFAEARSCLSDALFYRKIKRFLRSGVVVTLDQARLMIDGLDKLIDHAEMCGFCLNKGQRHYWSSDDMDIEPTPCPNCGRFSEE